MKKLGISETFFSIQGEGPTTGYPAVFVRTAGCPLACTFCDTTEVWKRGDHYTVEEFLLFLKNCYGEFLRSDAGRIVLTGGSPTMQQEQLTELLRALREEIACAIELETEGFVRPTEEFLECIDHLNISPKLSNSGVPYDKRINLETLHYLDVEGCMSKESIAFKFVVGTIQDVGEVLELVKELQISPRIVWLMPMADNRYDLQELSPSVIQWAKLHGFKFSTRLHLSVYDKKTGC